MGVRKININDVTKRIAALFRESLPELPEDARLVKLTDEDMNRLKKCRCDIENISIANSMITSFSMPEFISEDKAEENACYIMISGNFSLLANGDISEVELSSEWLYPWASFLDPKLRRGIGKDEINQFIWPYTQNGGVVDQDELIKLFPRFRIYRILPVLNGIDDLRLIVNMAYLDQPKYHSLYFSQNIIDEFKDSLSDPDPDVETLMKAFTSARWENCFFALYQCIEPLFNNLLAKTLKEALSISKEKDHLEITEILKKNALVIPDEGSVITVMYDNYLPDDLRESFCEIFNRPKGGDNAMTRGAVGKHIYSIRNKIVHQPQIASNNKQWNSNKNIIEISFFIDFYIVIIFHFRICKFLVIFFRFIVFIYIFH